MDNNMPDTQVEELVATNQTTFENPVITPEEVTAVQSELKNENANADAAAAAMCGMFMPRFRMATGRLSNNALRRIINALVMYPLVDQPKFRDNNERDAFLIGNKLLEAKYMLVISTMLANQEINNELQKAASEAAVTNEEVKVNE